MGLYPNSWFELEPFATYLQDMEVSWNGGVPKSSILIGFSIVNQLFWDNYHHFRKPPYLYAHPAYFQHHWAGFPGRASTVCSSRATADLKSYGSRRLVRFKNAWSISAQ